MGTFSDDVTNKILDGICRNTAFSKAAVYVKLHVGDPGGTGANNAAANTTRQAVTFGSASAARSCANTVAVSWTSVSTQETYSYVSLWDHATNSASTNHIGNDDLSSSAGVSTGDTFQIAIGGLTLSA